MKLAMKIRNAVRIVQRLFSRKPSTKANATISLAHFPRFRGNKALLLWISRRLRRSFGVYLSPHCSYGTGLCLKHPVGIVIGSGVTIGQDVTIFQNVTLGGRRLGDGGTDEYPSIGDRTVIFAGAVILGKVRVGNDCIIGANAVVIHDVPDGATAVGVPARVISRKESEQ